MTIGYTLTSRKVQVSIAILRELIHTDITEQVSKLSDSWRTATNSKRAMRGGGFGGISSLEKKRHYKALDRHSAQARGYDMVFDEDEVRRRHKRSDYRSRSPRSRSPDRSRREDHKRYDRGSQNRKDVDRDHHRDRDYRYTDRNRRR